VGSDALASLVGSVCFSANSSGQLRKTPKIVGPTATSEFFGVRSWGLMPSAEKLTHCTLHVLQPLVCSTLYGATLRGPLPAKIISEVRAETDFLIDLWLPVTHQPRSKTERKQENPTKEAKSHD